MAKSEAECAQRATFTLPELSELTGIDSRTLHNWMRRGVLTPSHQRASGSGTRNLFDHHDALFLVIVAELRRRGAEMPTLERVAAELREHAARSTGDELLMINGDVKPVMDAEQLVTELEYQGPAFLYAISRAHRVVAEFARGIS